MDEPEAALPEDPVDPVEHESFRERLREAAEEAERQTGYHERTEAEVRHSLHLRVTRSVAGFVVIALGIAALPLPGPGWLIIIVGLNLLPFAWAERTIRLIRRKVPGVPEEGSVPVHTWLIMGALTLAVTVASLLWADDVGDWMRSLTS
jgi:uncharacterized protein (TIGR02611 family)